MGGVARWQLVVGAVRPESAVPVVRVSLQAEPVVAEGDETLRWVRVREQWRPVAAALTALRVQELTAVLVRGASRPTSWHAQHQVRLLMGPLTVRDYR